MITTGCPLGDASSFLVRVGEYARVSDVFQFIFYCIARIVEIFKGTWTTVFHIWVSSYVFFDTFSLPCSLLDFCQSFVLCYKIEPMINAGLYIIHECLQCISVMRSGSSCQVPVATGREGCFRICHCDGTSRLGNCVNLECVQRKPCILRDKTKSKLKYSGRTVSWSDCNNNKVFGWVTEVTYNIRTISNLQQKHTTDAKCRQTRDQWKRGKSHVNPKLFSLIG